MSYRCDGCNEARPHGEAPNRVVLKTRAVEYRGGGRGREIVKEAGLCGPCAVRVVEVKDPVVVTR